MKKQLVRNCSADTGSQTDDIIGLAAGDGKSKKRIKLVLPRQDVQCPEVESSRLNISVLDSIPEPDCGPSACHACANSYIMCESCYKLRLSGKFRHLADRFCPRLKQRSRTTKTPAQAPKKAYIADLDLWALKKKLAELNLQWPGNPGMPARTSLTRRKTQSQKSLLCTLRLQKPAKTLRSSVGAVVKKSASFQQTKKTAGLAQSRSFLAGNPCKSHAVDLRMCQECSKEGLKRMFALGQLSERITDQRSILKHHKWAAPWTEEEHTERCVDFSSP